MIRPPCKETEDHSGECEAVSTRNLFTNLCRLEMDIICTNKRRLSSKTPSKRLIEDKVCKSMPPVWEPKNPRPVVMDISCETDYPKVSVRFWNKQNVNAGDDRCKICGCKIDHSNEKGWNSIPKACLKCGAKVHLNCFKKIGLTDDNNSVFSCSHITRFLRPGAIELPQVMDCVEAPEKRCLVCGEKRLNRSVECNEQ